MRCGAVRCGAVRCGAGRVDLGADAPDADRVGSSRCASVSSPVSHASVAFRRAVRDLTGGEVTALSCFHTYFEDQDNTLHAAAPVLGNLFDTPLGDCAVFADGGAPGSAW